MSAENDIVYQFYIGGELDDELAGDIVTKMAEFNDEDPTAFWNVVINSGGGGTEAGSAVAMMLRSYSERGHGSHFVTTIATGQCCSMATLIAQMGDRRITDELCIWVFHEPQDIVAEDSLTNMADDLRSIRRWNDIADGLVLERTTLTLAQYRRKVKGRNWFVMSDELLELGFVDEVW